MTPVCAGIHCCCRWPVFQPADPLTLRALLSSALYVGIFHGQPPSLMPPTVLHAAPLTKNEAKARYLEMHRTRIKSAVAA